MAYLKFKDENNQWQDLPAIRGLPGRDGAIQYHAGENITIDDNNVISANAPVILAWDGTTGSTTAVTEFFQQVIDAHTHGKDVFVIGRKDNSTTVGDLIFILRASDNVIFENNNRLFKMLGTAAVKVSTGSSYSDIHLDEMNINIYVSLSGADYVVTNVITATNGFQASYLDAQGAYTTPHTPTHAGQPTSKKYVDDLIGDLTALDTTVKTSLVAAINELVAGGTGVELLENAIIQLGTGSTGTKYDPKIYLVKGHSTRIYYNNTSFAPFPTDDTVGIALIGSVSSTQNFLILFKYEYNIGMYMTLYHGSNQYNIGLQHVAQTNTNQTFSMTQTFSLSPVCSRTPTDDDHLVNKKYVDDSIPGIYSGTTDPSSTLGEDGDIYVKYTS